MAEDDLDTAAALLEAATRAGADAADVLVMADRAVHIGVANGALEEVESAESREAGLRVLIGRRQACVAGGDLSSGALQAMADRAVALARLAPEDPSAGLGDPGDGVLQNALDLEDPTPDASPEDLEDLARQAEDAALSVDGVTMIEQAYASRERSRMTLAATNGFSGSYGRTAISVGASAIAGEGLGRERDHSGETRRHRVDLPDAASIGTRAGQRAVAALNPRKPPGGAVPVLFDERCAAGIVGHMLSALNGVAVARGASWLSQAMEQPILPKGMDLTEDPLIPRGLSSRPFDGEGTPSSRRAIVEDGVLKRWILDAATARKLGLTSTGNARRGLAAPPSPGVTNVTLSQGTASRDDLIRDMGRGLMVTSLIGASINPTTGAYSRGASGFWVEDGAIAYPVNELTIAGSLPEMIKSLVAANDADPHRSYQVPSLLVQGLTVGA